MTLWERVEALAARVGKFDARVTELETGRKQTTEDVLDFHHRLSALEGARSAPSRGAAFENKMLDQALDILESWNGYHESEGRHDPPWEETAKLLNLLRPQAGARDVLARARARVAPEKP